MASEKGPVATEATPFSSIASQTSNAPSSVSIEALAEVARATQSLKRHREATPTSPSSALSATLNPELSPSKAPRIAGLPSRHSPAPPLMTAAAAIEEQQRRDDEQFKLQVAGASENPQYKAHSALSTAALAMSRPEDAPTAGDTQPVTSPSVSIPTSTLGSDPKLDISPQSVTSMASLTGAPNVPVTDSPAPMELDGRNDRVSFGTQPPAQMEEKGASSLSYPGILPTSSNMPAPPIRNMSLPMTTSTQNTPRSPNSNSKKHKCPYCDTEFTRHHNLKSHLLTHSQEKPYICQTCSMRFRRLHDLKRHSKLHTGEKPHICPKCDRKFARGDALARHSKGPGGCVGRRSSLGSFGVGEDDLEGASHIEGDESAMTGIVYEDTHAPDMTEEERRRLGVPSIKAQHVQDHDSATSNAPNANMPPVPLTSGNTGSMYAQSAMTESPKPLSPSGLPGHDSTNIHRQRSPSLTTQFQQQHFGRHQSERQTPPVPGFTAADAARYAVSAASQAGTAPASQSASGSSNSHQVLSGPTFGHSRTPSGPGQAGSGDSTSNNLFATDQGIWAYIHSLEEQLRQTNDRVQAMETTERVQEEKIMQLSNEVTALRSQVELRSDPVEKLS